jgi:putative heme iron utilization protein
LYPDKDALADLDRDVRPVHSYNPLVQINGQIDVQIEAQAAPQAQIEESRV